MPTLTFQHSILSQLQRRSGIEYDAEEWEDRLPGIGCVVEVNDENGIEIEIFPDRPDLLSHENIARAARSFLHSIDITPDLEIRHGEVEMKVESSLAEVRPVILGAIVRGVENGSTPEEKDEFIQSLMDHQEKLHMTLGRRRKFSSIGVHDLAKITPPFRVTTVDGGYEFVPLAMEKEISIEKILTTHPKGIEYAHLVKGYSKYPLIIDSNEKVLSFPPIINGNHAAVSSSTTDFFIDVTGWDKRSCEACLLLTCLSLSERGGVIESIELTGWDNEISNCPRGDSKLHNLPHSLIQRILGIELSNEEIDLAIKKMGGVLLESRTVTDGAEKSEKWADCAVGEKEHVIAMPRWRSDIMHPVDIVEDIAIGYGYDNLPDTLSTVHIDAIPLKSSQLRRRVSSSLCALGLQETQSLTLSNNLDQFNNLRWEAKGEITEIANPITKEHTILRQHILPSLLNLLAANRHHELPQRIHELGTVVMDSKNQLKAAWACAEVGGGFAAAKGIAQALLRDLGAEINLITYQATTPHCGPWIEGRGAKVFYDGVEVGVFGEIDPIVSRKFGIKSPIQAGEFDINAIGQSIPDPVL